MTIGEVFAGVSLKGDLPPNLASLPVEGVEYDSRLVAPGYLFFAFAGQHADGRRFAPMIRPAVQSPGGPG